MRRDVSGALHRDALAFGELAAVVSARFIVFIKPAAAGDGSTVLRG